MKLTLIMLSFFLLNLSFFGQNERFEIDAQNRSAWNNAEEYPLESFSVANDIFQNSSEIGYEKGMVESELTLGLIALINGDLEVSLLKTLAAKEKSYSDSILAVINNQLARIYTVLGEYEIATDFIRSSISYNITNQSKNLMGNYVNFGNIKEDVFEIDSALYYYNKTFELASELKDTSGILAGLNNVGALYGMLGDFEMERTFLSNARSYVSYNSIQSCQILSNTGLSYLSSRDYDIAELYLDSAFSLSEELEFLSGKKSVVELQKIIAAKNLDYQLAYELSELNQELSIALIDENTSKRIAQIQLKSDFGQKQKLDSIAKVNEINAIELENEKQDSIRKEQIKKRNIVLYFGVALILLIGYIAYRLYGIGQERKKANAIISSQKVEVENQRDIAKKEHAVAEEQKAIVEHKNEEIMESITYAKRLQEAILPPQRLVKEWLTESFIYYKPKDIVAGDFYWMETAQMEVSGVKRTVVYFAAADCTGHGVPGAMVSVVCANALNRAVKEFELRDPGLILDKVTDLVIESFEKSEEEIKDGMDLALCALDIGSQELFYAGANNPLWVVSKQDSLMTEADYKSIGKEDKSVFLHEVKASKQPVGKFEKRSPFVTHKIKLNDGDELFISSDGFPDQFGGVKGKKYKSLNFKKFLLDLHKNKVTDQKDLLSKEFESWTKGYEQIDDVCVIGVKVNEAVNGIFTDRELEVVRHIIQGLSSKMIADEMSISKHTVDTYRRRILAKTNTHNAAELIKHCQEMGIV